MQAKTIATKLVAKYGVRRAHNSVLGRMRRYLYRGPLDGSGIHRAITWMVVGQLIEKVGNAQGWTDA